MGGCSVNRRNFLQVLGIAAAAPVAGSFIVRNPTVIAGSQTVSSLAPVGQLALPGRGLVKLEEPELVVATEMPSRLSQGFVMRMTSFCISVDRAPALEVTDRNDALRKYVESSLRPDMTVEIKGVVPGRYSDPENFRFLVDAFKERKEIEAFFVLPNETVGVTLV